MNEITRFDLDMDGSMEPSEHGRWVRYEDAQRQWVGLTEDEILKLAYPIRWQEVDDFEADKAVNFAQAIEAKLKEKNNG
jgi:hypothetical protein